MAKTYPPIDVRLTHDFYRIVNGVTDILPTKFTIKRVQRTTNSGTSPNFPEKLVENAFFTQTTQEEFQIGKIDSWSNNRPRLLTRNFEIASCPLREMSAKEIELLKYQATVRLYDEISGATANLALLYKERVKTGESILIAVNGILKAVRDVRNRRPPEIFMGTRTLRGRKRLSGAWLNYVYGIKPFCDDLYKISHFDPLTQVQWLSGKASERKEFSDTNFMSGGTYRVKLKYGISLKNPLSATMAQSGMLNPALIAWELTPFSFMADWIYPVGPFLENLTALVGYTKHGGSVTETWSYKGEAWSTQNPLTDAKHLIQWRRVTRSTTTFPSAPFPRIKNPFSPVRALNALSIIHQFTKSPHQRN